MRLTLGTCNDFLWDSKKIPSSLKSIAIFSDELTWMTERKKIFFHNEQGFQMTPIQSLFHITVGVTENGKFRSCLNVVRGLNHKARHGTPAKIGWKPFKRFCEAVMITRTDPFTIIYTSIQGYKQYTKSKASVDCAHFLKKTKNVEKSLCLKSSIFWTLWKEREKQDSWRYTLMRKAAGAHLPTPWLPTPEPANRP